MDEVVFKWWSEKYHLGMTKSGEVYRWQGGQLTRMNKEVFRSSLVYRIRGSSQRISRNQFIATCSTCHLVIERDLPF